MANGFATPEAEAYQSELSADGYHAEPTSDGAAPTFVYVGGDAPRLLRWRTPHQMFRPPVPGEGIHSVPGEMVEAVAEDPNSIATVQELLRGLYTMDPDDLRELQAELEAGGYFQVAPENIGWGRADRFTEQAYRNLLEEAAAYTAAGQRRTPEALLRSAAASRSEAEREFGTGDVFQIRLDDPATLRRLASTVSREVLGREPDPELESRIVNAVRAAQSGEQQQVIDARAAAVGSTPSTVVTDNVDPRARVEEMLRSEFPTEVAGMQGADGYGMFLQMLGAGGRGVA